MNSTTHENRQMHASATRPRPPENRRERNKREKLNRIVTAARKLFRANGYAQTTTQQIAEAADIGAGTLFLYAKSKEDLLVLVFRDEMRELIDVVYNAIPADAPFMARTEALFDGFIAYHKRDVAIARALIRELAFLGNPDRRAEVNAIPEAITEKLAEFVVSAQQHGEIRTEIDPGDAAKCLFAIYYGQLQAWLGGYVSYAEFKRNLHRLLAFFADGIRQN